MLKRSKWGAVALVLCAALIAPNVAQADTGQIRLLGGTTGYTGNVNVRSTSTITLTTPTGTVTCNNASGRLASFGTGSVTNSAVNATPASKGTLTRLSFGNPLLANASGQHDQNTTVLTSPNVPNGTPRCTSTIGAISGGCVAQTDDSQAASTRPVSVYTDGATQVGYFIRLQLTVKLYCKDSSGGDVFCSYSTGTSSSPGPVTSNKINYGTGTAVFSSVPVYRSSGSALCPATGTFTGTYQLFSGLIYPGGTQVVVAKAK